MITSKTINTVQVMDEVQKAQYTVQVLMAHGDGELKRRLNLVGDYKEHRREAARAVTDNAFYLAIALSTMGWLSRLRFARRVREVNEEMGRALKPGVPVEGT